MPGRKTKLTPEIQERIVSACKLGMPDEYVARLAGISNKTLQRWKQRGELGKSAEFRKFNLLIGEARSDVMQNALFVVNRAAIEGREYRAATWLLEKLFPEHFGKKANSNEEKKTLHEKDEKNKT